MPGDSLSIEVVLVEKAVINKGLRFVMREGKKNNRSRGHFRNR